MRKIYVVLSFLLPALLLPVSSLAFEIGARGYYWFPSLDGTVKVDEAGIIGTTLDFENDLGGLKGPLFFSSITLFNVLPI